jgi:cadmium resistance protein CadD (predicted permease)
MSSLPVIALASIATFAVTNVDDLVLLTLFFAQRVPIRNVLLGQCLGFAGIVALRLAGSWAAVTIPHEWLRLLGILPLGPVPRRMSWKRGSERRLSNRGSILRYVSKVDRSTFAFSSNSNARSFSPKPT